MDAIRANAPNTIVILTADNGAWLDAYPDAGTTPFRGEKGSAFEAGWRQRACTRCAFSRPRPTCCPRGERFSVRLCLSWAMVTVRELGWGDLYESGNEPVEPAIGGCLRGAPSSTRTVVSSLRADEIIQ